MGRVLIVDDEPGLRDALEILITSKGHQVVTADGVESGRAALERDFFDVVVTDLRLEPGGDGLELVAATRALRVCPEVIVMTAYGTREKAQRAVSKGASYYLEKGPHLATDVEVLVAQAINTRRLKQENDELRAQLLDKNTAGGIVGKSASMREALEMIGQLAPLKTTVLITGESGTGKERVARALHFGSDRRDKPFIPVNCGAFPESLIESELFGHEKGAFTGADTKKDGMVRAAEGGTLFLDEIGELPVSLQPKLLRVLQEHRIKPVGAEQEMAVDIRVVAATNRDLEAEVKAGRFREDLFFRLNVVQIDLPPLRQRQEDIPLLAQMFLRKYAEEYGRDVREIDAEALEKLLSFRFPGNVRQLQNVIERGVALAKGPVFGLAQLPRDIRAADSGPLRVAHLAPNAPFPDEGVELERLVEDYEHGLVVQALEKAGGVKTRAAELLGLTFRQFRYKLAKYERRGLNGGS